MRFRAVVFDLWMTLVPWDAEESERFQHEVAEAAGVDPERFSQAWLTGTHLPNRNTGPIAEHMRALFAELGVDPDLDELLRMRRERAKRTLVPRPEALPTLEELRRRVVPSSAVYSTSFHSARYSDSPPLVVASGSPA